MKPISKRILKFVLPVVLSIASIALAFGGCTSSDSKTIMFADASWDSIQVHNRIAAFILENGYGYEADYTFGDTIPLFNGLARGDIDVCMEVWVENQQQAYDEYIADGSVIDLGGNFLDNWQGWLVPTYMIEGDASRGIEATAPDLKSVFDLPQYKDLFKDPESPSKGRFVNGPFGWEATTINSEKLLEYGLSDYFTDFVSGSDTALASSLASAYEQGKPWLGYYWEPTWVLGKYDMTRLEEPASEADVWNTTHACAYPANNVDICVSKDFYNSDQDVVDFLSKYTTTTAMINQVLAYMQDQDANTEQAAEYFLKNFESTWTQWVPSDIAAKVKAALG
jgi:glycine betaine/proline transport system substrate-binding protein